MYLILLGAGCRMTFDVSLCFVVGKYHCPVLYNVFTNNSHIVANKVTGNVYSHEVGDLTSSV